MKERRWPVWLVDLLTTRVNGERRTFFFYLPGAMGVVVVSGLGRFLDRRKCLCTGAMGERRPGGVLFPCLRFDLFFPARERLHECRYV